MKFRVGQIRHSRLRPAVKMTESLRQPFMIFIVRTKIQITLAPVLLLVDQIVQKNVQALDPGEIGPADPFNGGAASCFPNSSETMQKIPSVSRRRRRIHTRPFQEDRA